KYKVNLIPFQKNLFSLNNMTFFYDSIKLLKEYKISWTFEILKYILSLPYRLFQKLERKPMVQIQF
ncbi:MAG: hypothetical protein FWG77_10080, partial [Treponema sp.]|nr:hypothetical protein [Treponema sp.]